MEIVLFVLAGMAIATLIYGIMIYNNLVRLKHSVTQAWSNIDVLLKQRHDELPKLVETCKQYMKFEQETLERVMLARSAVASARQQGDIGAVGSAESALRLGLGNLFAVAENYPDLKANDNFLHLQSRTPAWRTASPTGGSSTMRASTTTMYASSSFPTSCWPVVSISRRRNCLSLTRRRPGT